MEAYKKSLKMSESWFQGNFDLPKTRRVRDLVGMKRRRHFRGDDI